MKRWNGRLLLSIMSVMALLLSACGGAPPVQTGEVAAGVAAALDTVDIYVYDFSGFSPKTISVEKPGRYTVNVVNKGTMEHQVTFGDGVSVTLRARETRSADVNIPAEGLEFGCATPGHGPAEESGVITVGGVTTVQQPESDDEQEQAAVEEPAAGSEEPAAGSEEAAAGSEEQQASQQQTSGEVKGTLEIVGEDISFSPMTIDVPEPGRYTVMFANHGAILHDVTFPDGTKIVAEAGESGSAEVDVPAGGLNFICSIPGHAQAGMKGTITVGGAAATEHGGGNEGGDHGGPPPATDVQPDPNAPAYTPFDPAARAAAEGTTHEIDLVIEEKEMTVAEGFVQKVWTFGGTVPGPVIRVRVGDTIRVRLVNPETSAVPHSIDFHSSQVAWNDEMVSINPGEELIYEWKADYAGVWMYHCGTAPALHHIANGMYGMVIVEPKEGLPEVDKEFALVQSEWYLGPQKDLTSLEKASAAAPAPDYVVFNGVANQYAEQPLEVGTGERVRIFVLNAGPSVDSSFHVVGTIFDTVTKEGVQLDRGNPGNYGAQAVDLAPAQGAIVEFATAEDGMYPIVTHAFNFVGRGALGMIKSGDGDPKK